jgi:bacterioferritin-associated ferredoxin
MIVCSCNVISDNQLRAILANTTTRPRMSQIYRGLGTEAQCGRCAHSIKRIVKQMTHLAIGSIASNVSLQPDVRHSGGVTKVETEDRQEGQRVDPRLIQHPLSPHTGIVAL